MKLTKKHLKEIIEAEIKNLLTEATDDVPEEDWVEFGSKVDDFINETVKKAHDLHEEGEKLLFDEEVVTTNQGEKYRYISSRMGFLKNLRYKLAQKFEGLRREI
jgi:hypothetical protein